MIGATDACTAPGLAFPIFPDILAGRRPASCSSFVEPPLDRRGRFLISARAQVVVSPDTCSTCLALLTREEAVASVCPCATSHFRNASCFIATPDHLPERC
jgi:hypothetical protein